MENLYRAVDAAELVRVLGAQCSPDPQRKGYVIGPDVTGRLCHVASCFSMGDAVRRAEEMNRKAKD